MKRCRQQGFSLVEMMVALVIGLFVLAGVGSVYITGKRSYQARDGLSLLQENGRTAIRLIEQSVVRAGYPMFAEIQPVVHGAGQLLLLRTKTGKSASKALGLELAREGTGIEGDTLSIQYQPVKDAAWEDGEDCVGNESEIDGRVISTFFVEKGTLKCRGSGKASAEPLVDNVISLQVEYGEDANSDGFADKYSSLNDVDGNNWNRIVAIRIGLLISSGEDVLDEPVNKKQTFTLAGQQVTLNSKNDRKLYRVFQTTIPLRNRMPIL